MAVSLYFLQDWKKWGAKFYIFAPSHEKWGGVGAYVYIFAPNYENGGRKSQNSGKKGGG